MPGGAAGSADPPLRSRLNFCGGYPNSSGSMSGPDLPLSSTLSPSLLSSLPTADAIDGTRPDAVAAARPPWLAATAAAAALAAVAMIMRSRSISMC